MKTIIGIDPGAISAAWGCIQIIDAGDVVFKSCGDIDVVDRQINATWLINVLRNIAPGVVVVERVHAFPAQGVSSSFRFGVGYGIIQGVIATMQLPSIDVSPTVWKRHFKLDRDKEKSRALALKRLPLAAEWLPRVKDSGRAEALLMALWYAETT